MSKIAKALVALVAATTVVFAPVAAHAVTPGVGDKTNAVRYGGDGPLGTIAEELEFSDDTSVVIESPFLLNFFGETYTHLCVSNNGGVFPTNDTGSDCGEYDYDVATLADNASAPMVAVLASDTDTSACDSTRATVNDNGTPDDSDDDTFAGIDDGWALPCSVYIGETTVDGAAAFVVTWYRVSQFEDENDPTLFNTYQLLLIKRSTGDNVAGWDFDFEFNYATLTDDEDGYQVDPETGLMNSEDNECDAYTDPTKDDNNTPDDTSDDTFVSANKNVAAYANCRWGIGVGKFSEGVGSVGYEFFEQYSIGQLIDSGDTAMIKHSLGSNVLGRYRCSMINGEARGCDFSAALAETGTDANGFGLAGAALIAAGGIALAVRRRKA